MRISTYKDLVGQGIKGVWRNKMMSFASFCILLVSLLLVGLTFLLAINLNKAIDSMEEKNEIVVIIKDETTKEQIDALGDSINSLANIASCQFFSRDQAWKDMVADMTEEEKGLFQYADKNPLPDTYRVTVADIETMANTTVQISAFETSHDTRQSCGYRIETPDGKSCCVCTDLGYVSETVHQNLTGCDMVLLEANYDLEMLRNGPYPFPLKQRIASKKGHLCNNDSAAEIDRLVKSGTTQIILGHLSQENNTPDVAGNTVIRTLTDLIYKRDYILRVAPVETHGEAAEF